jgi:hypothetical protein
MNVLESEIITLSNGKRVANFSSAHSFTFEDGSVLAAHDKDFAELYKVNFHESVDDDGDVSLSFSLSLEVLDLVAEWMRVYREGLVDVVFIPLPMLQPLKDNIDSMMMLSDGDPVCSIKETPFRAIRRISRTDNVISIWKQCL